MNTVELEIKVTGSIIVPFQKEVIQLPTLTNIHTSLNKGTGMSKVLIIEIIENEI